MDKGEVFGFQNLPFVQYKNVMPAKTTINREAKVAIKTIIDSSEFQVNCSLGQWIPPSAWPNATSCIVQVYFWNIILFLKSIFCFIGWLCSDFRHEEIYRVESK